MLGGDLLFNIERKLNKKNIIPVNKELSNREIVKALSTKRDAIFQQELDTSGCNLEEQTETNSAVHSLSSIITNSLLFNALEKKIAPHSQALDPQELQKLIDADLLNLARDLEWIESNSQSQQDKNTL